MAPAPALLVFGGLLAGALLVLWPGWGVLARLKRGMRSTERVLLEDALKHVYVCRAVGRDCTVAEVAESLGVSETLGRHRRNSSTASTLPSVLTPPSINTAY